MPNQQRGIDLKLERADRRLEELIGARGLYLADGDHRPIKTIEPETGDLVVRVGTDHPDEAVGITLAEFAHHLRSSLDNLLWQVVVNAGNTPTSKSQFPIAITAGDFDSQVQRGRIDGVSAEDRDRIRSIQPFHGPVPEWHALALLHRLNIIDKHHHLVVAVAAVPHFYVGRPVFSPINASRFPGGGSTGWSTGAALMGATVSFRPTSGDPAEVMRITPERGESFEVAEYPEPTLELAFGDGDERMTIFDFIDIRNCVREVHELLS